MKTVLCFGDSNTWGYDPLTRERFDRDTRWPGVLRNELGEGYLVLEEGLNGRTTVWDDPIDGTHKNGSRYLLPCLESHAPLDLVVIMLGTNDLKRRFGVPAEDIARGAARLVGIVRQSMCGPRGDAPQVLLVAPPPTTKLTRLSTWRRTSTGGSEKQSPLALGNCWGEVSRKHEDRNFSRIVLGKRVPNVIWIRRENTSNSECYERWHWTDGRDVPLTRAYPRESHK